MDSGRCAGIAGVNWCLTFCLFFWRPGRAGGAAVLAVSAGPIVLEIVVSFSLGLRAMRLAGGSSCFGFVASLL